MLKPIRKGSLVDTAIESIRQTIECGEWPVGTRLPVEAELSEALGISRNTIREAVRVLVHVGMLETRQGDGTYVRADRDAGETLRRISRSKLAEQMEVRTILETEAARLAALRRTESDLKAMADALDARAAASDKVSEKIAHDERFHQALVKAAHNPALLELYDYFFHAVSQTIEHTERDADLPEPSQEAHELLLAAIRRKDPEKAEALSRSLLAPSLNALTNEASS